ncbi:hypothetical protein FRC03_010185 [Tulasnella sp. 419]|nr:hypothetical protein FRC03_010185 [Tulasnella sp. 419]
MWEGSTLHENPGCSEINSGHARPINTAKIWLVWAWVVFNHENVVPALGLTLSSDLPYAIVSPWY